jgi:hypothetical protein
VVHFKTVNGPAHYRTGAARSLSISGDITAV